MKIKRNMRLMLAVLLIASSSLISCTKEGPAGLPGKDGENGINGQDGTATCAVCHDNNQENFAISRHREKSLHATGGNFVRNSTDCAGCHTSQGFREIILTGADETAAPISNPNPPNCYTCHNIHTEYSTNDWALATTDPVIIGTTGDVFDKGKGNLCASCHKPQDPGPMPVVDGEDMFIASKYWGPHYGSQAAMVAGKGGFEVGTSYASSNYHVNIENSCVSCHLVENSAENAGGHMMNLSYGNPENPTVLTTACVSCHADNSVLITKITNVRNEINDLMAQLKSKLLEKEILDNTDHIVPGTWPANYVGSFVNYSLVLHDGSNGIHNYKYMKSLLVNSIEALD